MVLDKIILPIKIKPYCWLTNFMAVVQLGQYIYPITLTGTPMFGTSWVISNNLNTNQIIVAPNPPIIPNQTLPPICTITGEYNQSLKQLTFTAPNCINGSGTAVTLPNCVLGPAEIFYNNKYVGTWVIVCPASQQSLNELTGLTKTKDYQATSIQPAMIVNNHQNNFWLWIVILVVIILIFVFYYKNNKVR